MKKFLALLLCLMMVFSLVACGEKEPAETENPGTSTTEPSETPSNPDETPAETIRPNGELPANEKKLTDAEIRHYVGVVMNAALTLDTDTLKEYAKNEEDVEVFETIKNDPTSKEWFEKTIGKSIYLESTGQIVYPECSAVFNMWYTDMWKDGVTPPAECTELSIDELTAIYNKYADKIPYVIDDVNPEYDCPIYLKDGRIYFELDELLGCTSYCYDNADLAPSKYSFESATQHIAAYVLGHDADSLDPTYDDLFEEDSFDRVKPLINKNLDELVTYLDSLKAEYDWNATPGEDDYYLKVYQAYLKNDTNRAKIQSWIQDNFVCGFSVHSFEGWVTIDVDNHFMYDQYTAEEKAALKNVWLCDWIYESAGSEAKHAFSPCYDIIDTMIENGVLTKDY